MQYGFTAKAQDSLKLSRLSAPEEVDPAFCWDISKLRRKNRNVFVIVNTNNRFCVVAAGMKMVDVKDLSTFLKTMISQCMSLNGYTMAQIERYFQMAGEVVLTKTHGRKAVGDMTIAIRSMELLDNHFLSDWLYQPDFSDYLNGDICRPTGYSQWGYPHEFFRKDMERLGIVA